MASRKGIDLESSDKIKTDMLGNKCTVNQERFLNTGKPIPAQISIYTESSKTVEHVGAGFVIYRHGWKYTITHLSEEITIYQAEVLTIKLAARNKRGKRQVCENLL